MDTVKALELYLDDVNQALTDRISDLQSQISRLDQQLHRVEDRVYDLERSR